MGLFARRKPVEYDDWAAAEARTSVLWRYRDAWVAELEEPDSTYGYRARHMDDAITVCQRDPQSPEAESAAYGVMADSASAGRFLSDVADGRVNELRARLIVEAHRRLYMDAVNSFLAERGLVDGQIFKDETDDTLLQAHCLAEVRDLFDDSTWSGLRTVLSTSSSRHIFADLLPE